MKFSASPRKAEKASPCSRRAASSNGPHVISIVPAYAERNSKKEQRVFFSDSLLRHGSVMFVATTLAGALNYIYQVYMGRALGPEDYSVFGALFAIFYMMEGGDQWSKLKFQRGYIRK